VCVFVGGRVCVRERVKERKSERERERDREYRLLVEFETMIRWVRDDLMTCRVRDMTH